MNYEKKYNEALKRAIIAYKDEDRHLKATLEGIFPELKKNEDEKIIKELTDFIKKKMKNSCSSTLKNVLDFLNSWVSWTEKQGEDPCEHCNHGRLNCHNFPCIEKRAFKQGKSVYEVMTEENADNADYRSIDPQFGKPIDKAETRFHKGDWVVNNYESEEVRRICEVDIANNLYILSIDESHFIKTNPIGLVNVFYHLWTIKDAKDGDVLSYISDEGDLWVMIYQSLYEPYEGCVHYHALLFNDNFKDGGTCSICIDNLKPATEEQRDLLFQKMHEDGYKWDSENKKLIKI